MDISEGPRDLTAARRTRTALIAGFAALALLPTARASADEAPIVGAGQPGAIAGHYIVVMKDGAGAASADRVEGLARAGGGKVMAQYRQALTGFSGKMSSSTLSSVRADADVAYVEPDAAVRAEGDEVVPPADLTSDPTALWNLDRIDQRDLPLNQHYTYATTGNGVTAYVIDSGIRITHEEFGGRATYGHDFVDDDDIADDCEGHGTNVAATLGGTTYGVAKSVKLVSVRVLDCDGKGSDATVLAGVDWVTQHHAPGTPAVANISIGGVPGQGTSPALDAAVRSSIASGVTYAVAAGNHDPGEDANACDGSPADVPDALTVGASTITDTPASFSNTGPCVDLFAPGQDIVSAYIKCLPADTGCTPDNAAAIADGTSMATPHVAGVAAQYLETFPTATPATVSAAILGGATPNTIEAGAATTNKLLYSALDTTTPPPTTTPPATTTPSPTTPSSLTIFSPGASSSATSTSTSSATAGGAGRGRKSSASTSLHATSRTPRITALGARRVSGRVRVRMKVTAGTETRLDFLSHRTKGVLAHRTLKSSGVTQVVRLTVSRYAHYLRATVTMPGATTLHKLVAVTPR